MCASFLRELVERGFAPTGRVLVVLEGADFDAAKDAARARAERTGALYVEDGLLPEIAEGAGTIAFELGRLDQPLDAIFVPLGNGSLGNGIGTWLKHPSP